MHRLLPARLLPPILGLGLLCGCEPEPAPHEPAEPTLRRLTVEQYANSVRDLLGDDVVVPSRLEPDVAVDGYLQIGSAVTSISPRGVEFYEAAAFDLAAQALGTGAGRLRLVPCDPGVRKLDDGCAREALAALGRRAWRRPLTEDELERTVAVHAAARATLGDFYSGLTYGIAALLQSPHFLYREELGEPSPGGGRRFTDHELATRLSYLFWNTTPDDALLDAADRGELTTDEGLLAAAERLLADPRARDGLRAFFDEMLELHELHDLAKDPLIFEHWSFEVPLAAREQTLRDFETLVFDEDGDYRNLLTAQDTWLDRKLAAIYDVRAPAREGFARARLPDDGGRRGLLGHASLLSLHARPVSSSATLRGKFVRETLLCHTIPPPPSNVDTSIPEPSGEAPTLRDRVAEHLQNPACASCHLVTDPVGLGLENFDGIGRFRTHDGGALIDPSGDLDGVEFADAWELAQALRDHEDLGPCFVKQLHRYGGGHVETTGERGPLATLAEGFAERDHSVRALALDYVLSPLFRVPGEPTPGEPEVE